MARGASTSSAPNPCTGAQVVNGRAFVWRQAVEPGYAIVSLRTGKVLRTIRGRYAPALLEWPGAPFYG